MARSTTVAAFLIGLPLGLGFLALVHYGPLRDSPMERYLRHGVECVEVIMFAVAAGALVAKVAGVVRERRANAEILPPWSGKPVPVAEAPRLLAGLANQAPSGLVVRVTALLDFLARRGSAAELDDQMRDLADADRDALEGSYALVRFITWAIPILGFLGTVLGITGAISGVTPERLETDLNSVTDGLALAFDSTALALGLTMLIMFLTYLVERAEEGVLHATERYVTLHLAHRFERVGGEAGVVVEAVRATAATLLDATQHLVQRQADVWAKALDEFDRRRTAVENQQQQRLTASLEAALERTLQTHADRLAHLEKQAPTLARLAEEEAHLLRLQETLSNNLEALRGAGAFEDAVHSLTAAIHLLTARSGAPPVKRPGVAA